MARLVQRNEPNPNIHLFFDVAVNRIARNTLQLARGDGTYAELPNWPAWSGGMGLGIDLSRRGI